MKALLILPLLVLAGCASTASSANDPAVDLADGSTRLGWFAGDVSAGNGFTVTVEVEAVVAGQYSGDGEPAAGEEVLYTTLFNDIRPYFNLGDGADG